jgi:holliday junction DNA helicase RuvB
MLGEPGWRHLGLKVPRSAAPLLDILGAEE